MHSSAADHRQAADAQPIEPPSIPIEPATAEQAPPAEPAAEATGAATIQPDAPRPAKVHARTTTSTDVLVIAGILIAVVIVLGMIILLVRRRMLAAERASDDASGFLDELRALRREGKMTQEEFELAKRKLTTAITRSLDRGPDKPERTRIRGGGSGGTRVDGGPEIREKAPGEAPNNPESDAR